MSWYRDGVVALAAGSKAVAGTGTQWTANVKPGGMFLTPAGLYEVETVANDGQIQLVTPYAGTTASNVAYAIAPTQGYILDLAKQVGLLLAGLGQMKDAYDSGFFNGKIDAAVLSAARGAAQIGFTQPHTGGVLRTIEDRLRQEVFIEDFGAKADGITSCSGAFALASIAALGKRLVVRGTFLIGTTVTLIGGVDYDFSQAKFIPGAGCGSYLFRVVGETNFRIIGGDYSFKAGVTPQVSIPTGVYSSCTMIYIENCSNFTVRDTTSSRAWTHINVYNSSSFLIENNHMVNCNAGLAGVATTSASGAAVTQHGVIVGNRILMCGDDGIFVGPQQATAAVRHILVMGNTVTKTTNSVNTIDGSVVAAVLIRIGNNIATPGTTEHIQVMANILADAVDTAILCAAVSRCVVSNNVVKGWAKRQADAFRLGVSAALPFDDSIFSDNIAYGNVVDARAIGLVSSRRSTIRGNKVACSIGGEGALRADASTDNLILENTLWNTKAYGISMESGSGGNTIELNNLSVYVALPVRDLNTTGVDNTYRLNKGYTTRKRILVTQPAGSNSVLVPHGTGPYASPGTVSLDRLRISLQGRTSMGTAKTAIVTNVTAGNFNIQTDVAPGVDVLWDCLAEVI